MKLKRIFTLALTGALVFSSSTIVFAAESDYSNYKQNIEISNEQISSEINMNTLDLTQPIKITKEQVKDNGEVVIVTSEFKPNKNYNSNILSRGTVTGTASVGSWKTTVSNIAGSMSFEYDLSKSGSNWKISNARNFSLSVVLSTISNKSLTINRSTSTASFPAEVYANADINVLDTTWGSGATVNAWIKVTVSNSGVITTTHN